MIVITLKSFPSNMLFFRISMNDHIPNINAIIGENTIITEIVVVNICDVIVISVKINSNNTNPAPINAFFE